MESVFFLLTATLISYYIVLKIFEPQFKAQKRMEAFLNNDKNKDKKEEKEGRRSFKDIINGVMDKSKTYFGDKITYKQEKGIDMKLARAGNPMGMAPIDFYVYSIILKVSLPVVFAIYGKFLKFSFGGIFLFGITGFVVSMVVPGFYLNQKIRERGQKAIRELPDFLDILTVCLEAGLGFDAALTRVISKSSGVLSSEFHICLEEIRLGKTRKEALTGVKERIDLDEVKSLINSILQAEKLGFSVVQMLRVKSQEEREKRKQRAEEQAMKAPVKILFPLLLFIFPSIFIVVLGPAVIQIIDQFIK